MTKPIKLSTYGIKGRTVAERVRQAIRDDGDYREEKLISTYESLSANQKFVVDWVFTDLCGFKLCTLISGQLSQIPPRGKDLAEVAENFYKDLSNQTPVKLHKGS